MNTTRRGQPVRDIPSLVDAGRDLSVAVAYITRQGIAEIKDELTSLLQLGRRVRIMLDLQSGNSDPSAVWDLLGLADLFPTLEIKTIVPSDDYGILHSKLFIAHDEGEIAFLTGSANLTGAALHRNLEHSLMLEGSASDPDLQDAVATFESFWTHSHSRTLDDEAALLYEAYCGRLRRAESRSHRRAQSSWRALIDHLNAAGTQSFSWPSLEGAYLMGAIAARGQLHPDKDRIDILLGFSPGSYKDGLISVREVSFNAHEVIPKISEAIASRVEAALPDASVTIAGRTINIDVSNCEEAMQIILGAYSPHTSADSFLLPKSLTEATDDVVIEFLRGFAVACALVTDHTSMPRSQQTGEPGQMMVWLRPKQANLRLFDAMYRLITGRLGFHVYQHRRMSRDPHLKIHCENFQQIGFGIGWWDELVEAGAQYNATLYGSPQEAGAQATFSALQD